MLISDFALQKYGKKRTYAILNQNKSLANHFLYKMCQFVYDEHVPVQDVILLFEHINALGLNIGNLNSLNYTQLKSMVDGETSKEQSFRGDAIYTSPTKLVEVYYIDSFEKAQSFFSNTTWCICNNREQWNILRKNGSTFYLIVNRNFSMRSKCRFVIARVYPNGNIEYIDMSNNAIISGGGNKPNYDTYANSLEGAIQHLKPQQPIQENNNKYTNKNIMKINESQLRKIIKESVNTVLKEISTNLLRQAANKAVDDIEYFRDTNNDELEDKRWRQHAVFSDELRKRDREEKNAVCPYVPESELKNLPKDTYLVIIPVSRYVQTNIFILKYSGHADTKEQCEEFIDKYYSVVVKILYLCVIFRLKVNKIR